MEKMVSASYKWVNWTSTLVDIEKGPRICQDVDGESNRTRSTFEFQVSLDTKNEGSNFCKLKLICKIIRKELSNGCRDNDYKNFLLTFGNLSVRASIYGEGSQEKSFTKWFHVECPENLKMATSVYGTEHQVVECTDINFISKEEAAQMKDETDRISCDLVIFGLLTEIREGYVSMIKRLKFKRRLDDCSLLGTLLFPALPSRNNTNRECGTSNEDEVKFVQGNSLEYVEGNKFLLAAESPVFRKMLFETDMLEKSTGIIIVPKEITLEALKTFVKLCQNQYNENFCHTNIQNLLQVLSLAHMYQADRVKDICIMIIMAVNNRSVEIEIAVELLSAAGLYNIPDFRVRAFEWMKWRSETPPGKDEVLEFLKTAAKDVQMDFFNFLL